jgi:hypothetical protein
LLLYPNIQDGWLAEIPKNRNYNAYINDKAIMLLEKTKGAIKNGKSRTHKKQDEDKQNQKTQHNTEN